jgi:hypothetical protein
VTVLVCVRLPLVPRDRQREVPRCVLDFVLTFSGDLDVAGFGLKDELVRFGGPLTLSDTEPLKPLTGAIVTA